MPAPLSEQEQQLIRTMIQRTARSIRRKCVFNPPELEELEQEFFAAFLVRFRNFNPGKLTLEGFTRMILSQLQANWWRQRFAKKRDRTRILMDIEEYADPIDSHELCVLRLDIETLLDSVPPHVRRVAESLKRLNQQDAAKELELSRSSVQRAVRRLKKILKENGYS